MRTLRFWLSVLTGLVLLCVSFGAVAAQGDVTYPAFTAGGYIFRRSGTLAEGRGVLTYLISSTGTRGWRGRFDFSGLEVGKMYDVKVFEGTTSTGQPIYRDVCSFITTRAITTVSVVPARIPSPEAR